MARLAIQVILYHSEDTIDALKASLEAQTFRDFEVVYRDNSIEENIGFAGGHVELMKKHSAPFVMLLNDDAKLDALYLEHAMNRILSDENIGSVTGLVYRFDGQTIDTTGLEYKCLAQVVDRQTIPSTAGEVFGVSGAVGLYRRSAIEKAGGLFDPTWFMYKEDVDLALRLRDAGFTAWFEPKAIAWHKRGIKAGDGYLKRPAILRKHSYVNQWRIYRRHWKSASLSDKLRTIAVELRRSLYILFRTPKVFFQAWYDILA